MTFEGDDEDLLFMMDDEDMGFRPTQEQRKAMMGSFDGFQEEDASTGAQVKSTKVRAFVLMQAPSLDGMTHYVIRLSLPDRQERQWYLKKYGDFASLEASVREGRDSSGWGEQRAITHMPELPQDERFGIRRRLSLMGLTDFTEKQRIALQEFLDQLLVQLPSWDAEPLIEQFFSHITQLEAHKVPLEESIVEAGADVTMARMKGYWKLKGSQHVWTLEKTGKALLNGKHRGADYDVTEAGEGAERKMTRPDGWEVDLEKSNINYLVWYKAGHADLEWTRETTEAAEKLIAKYAAKREKMERDKKAKAEKAKAAAAKDDGLAQQVF